MRTRTKALLVAAGGLFALWVARGAYAARSVPSVPYETLTQFDGVELRRYPPAVLAETTAPDQRTAFGRLFRYIDGANEAREEVAMTAPVATRSTGTEVSMTAPVRTRGDETGVTMGFYLPEEYDAESAPVPTESGVRLVVEPERTVAVTGDCPLDRRPDGPLDGRRQGDPVGLDPSFGDLVLVDRLDDVLVGDGAVALGFERRAHRRRLDGPVGDAFLELEHTPPGGLTVLPVGRLDDLRTARVEPAAVRRVDRRRHVARELDPLAVVGRVGRRDARHQHLGVGVVRVREQLPRGRLLDDLAQVHDRHPVAHLPDDREVVADEQHRQVHLVGEPREEREDAGLDADVERAHRLVGDQQLRLDRQRAGDGDALALAAGELVGVPVEMLLAEADALDELAGPLPALGRGVADAVDAHGFDEGLLDGVAGVQRGERVLEDHLRVAPERPELAPGELREVLAAEVHRAAGQLEELEGRPRERALATAALADEPDGAAGPDSQVDAVDGADPSHLLVRPEASQESVALGEVLLHPLEAEHGLAARTAVGSGR